MQNKDTDKVAQDYLDTTLRSSHYKQQQRIEDQCVNNTKTLSLIKVLLLTNLVTIVLTWVTLFFYTHNVETKKLNLDQTNK